MSIGDTGGEPLGQPELRGREQQYLEHALEGIPGGVRGIKHAVFLQRPAGGGQNNNTENANS